MPCVVSNETYVHEHADNISICTNICLPHPECNYSLNLLKLPVPFALLCETFTGSLIYGIVISLLSLVGLINNLLVLITIFRERLRITNLGFYLIILSICNNILMVFLVTDLISVQPFASKMHRYATCFPSAYISNIVDDMFSYLSVAMIVERVLIECFNFNLVGSRKRACFVSCMLLVLVCLCHIPELFIRNFLYDLKYQWICIYRANNTSILNRLQYSVSFINVIFSSLAHLISIICILTTIARRKIVISADQPDRLNFIQIWRKQFYIHRDFLLPPLSILLCSLPHSIIHPILLTQGETTSLLPVRIHVALLIFRYLPSILTFLIYIYPNRLYWKEFQQTFIYRCFNRSRTFHVSLFYLHKHRQNPC